MNKLRKALTIGVMVMTVIAGFGPSVNAAAPQAGDLIKMDGLSTVYFLGNDGKRYVYPNSATFFSWHKDFSGVVTVSSSELASYPLGSNVVMRAGTKLVKITTDPSVYAVEPNGVLRKIQSEADAIALYGSMWAKRVVDVADSFFTNYTVGTPLTSGQVPAGSLVKNANSASVYYFDGTNYRTISSESAFNANRFDFANVITVTSAITAGGNAITTAEVAYDAQGGSTGPVIVGSGVTVSLSASTPAANDLPKSTSNSVLKFNITAANDGAAVISGVKLTAIGLGDPSKITAISVYKDSVKLNNTARNIDSNKEAQINFTNAVTIPAGTTATFEVRATFGDTGKHGLSIAKATDVMAGNTVSGSFPVAGNIFTGVDVTVGDLVFDKDGSALSEVKLGDKGATVAKFKMSNNANVEDITVKAVTFKKESTSSASDNAVENLKLNFDGKEVASAASISGRYVTFVLANPIVIAKNTANKRMTITADVVDGAGKTIGFMLESSSDITTVGNYYGYQTTISGTATDTGLLTTIKAGTISVEKINAAVDTLRVDVDNQEAGTFKITANSGKNAELSTLKLSIASSNDNQATATAFAKIENVEVYNKTNNTVYDLAYVSGTATKVYSNTSMGLMLTSGVTNELVVRFDTLTGSTAKDYTVSIANATTDLIIKETGNDTAITDITPNSVSLKKVTIEGASAEFSLNALSTAFNAVIGTEDVEVLNFNVKAGQTSDVYVKDLTVSSTTATSVALPFNNQTVSVIKLWKGTSVVKSVSSSQISGADLTFTDLNEKVAANTTNSYKVTVSFVKNTDSSNKHLKMKLNGATVEDVDGKDITESGATATSQREVTLIGTGTLTATMDNTNAATKDDSYQLSGTDSIAVASVKLKANNEDVKITKLSILASSTATSINNNIARVSLYDGATEVAYTDVASATSSMTGLSIVVPQSEKTYTIKVKLSKYGKDQVGELNKNYQFALLIDEAQGVSSGDTVAAVSATSLSKTMGAVATKISAVSFVNSYNGVNVATSLSSDTMNNAAIIAVTAPATTNVKADGSEIKTAVKTIKVKVDGNAAATTTVATLERIGGSGTATSSDAVIDGNGYFTFTLSNVLDSEIKGGETAYFALKVKTVDFTGDQNSGSRSLTANLDNLNGGNIVWAENDGGANKSDLRLSITKLDGTTIKN
jgi:hypothetical protein